MLDIFICEDNDKQLLKIKKLIEDTVLIEDYDMKVVITSSDPKDIINYTKEKRNKGIYFLDIDLGVKNINGFVLAQEIRKYDNYGYIIFITSHSELSYLTFVYKVEAMDFIIKDNYENIKHKIKDCLKVINARDSTNNNGRNLIIKSNDRIINIDFDEIIYFETSQEAHKILLHGETRDIEFFGNMKNIEIELDERFYRCNRSYIVNRNKIKEIDILNRIIYLKNGDQCLVSFRKIKNLLSKKN